MLALVNELETSRDMISEFAGYNHSMRCGENEFYNEQNMTADYYPILSPRKGRSADEDYTGSTINGLCSKNGLIKVIGTDLIYKNEKIASVEDSPKKMCGMGGYVIILPDKLIFNTKDLTIKKMEASFTTSGVVKFSMCTLEGSSISPITEEPVVGSAGNNTNEYWLNTSETPAVLYQKYNSAPVWRKKETSENGGIYWLDTTQTPNALKVWNQTESQWSAVSTSYTKIESTGIGKEFENYDVVKISGVEGTIADTFNQDMALWGKGEDYIIVTALIDQIVTQTTQITLERKIPDMDFICESENRLWGCSSEAHEIYCSKQGDPTNWYSYLGTAADSYAATVGSDGDFTGACAYGGQVLFFKENCIHKVYGSYPSNYQIQTTHCRGVQKGSENSLQLVNEVLYYKARDCICAYDGSLPVSVSKALGEEKYSDASAGNLGSKYYISQKGTDDTYHIFVYDTDKGIWHKEEEEKAELWTYSEGILYYVSQSHIKGIGNGEEVEGMRNWFIETGIMGLSYPNKKYISQIYLRLSMEVGAELYIDIEYDSSGEWIEMASIKNRYETSRRDTPSFTKMRSYELPINPMRCDHMRLRIRGKGNVKIFSISKVNEQGGY